MAKRIEDDLFKLVIEAMTELPIEESTPRYIIRDIQAVYAYLIAKFIKTERLDDFFVQAESNIREFISRFPEEGNK